MSVAQPVATTVIPPGLADRAGTRVPERQGARGSGNPHRASLPLRVGTRASPLALVQTRAFLAQLTRFCPVMRQPLYNDAPVFQEHAIRTTGDAVQDRALAEIGGKGLFAKEIHEALRIVASTSRCTASRTWKPPCRRASCWPARCAARMRATC